ncbi:MAG: hypothetical protein ACUVTO_06845 [Candidatus Caldatribacteriaceae bacterium]
MRIPQGQELLLQRISPQNLLRKALREDENEKLVAEIIEVSLRYPQLLMIENQAVLRNAIVQGVRAEIFGIRIGGQIHFKTEIPTTVFDADAILGREVVEQTPPSSTTTDRASNRRASRGRNHSRHRRKDTTYTIKAVDYP